MHQESVLSKLSSLCLADNQECASYKVDGIMRSVHPVHLSGECIKNAEVFVHWQECVNHVYTQPRL